MLANPSILDCGSVFLPIENDKTRSMHFRLVRFSRILEVDLWVILEKLLNALYNVVSNRLMSEQNPLLRKLYPGVSGTALRADS
jgi:hypothetical protein